MSTAAQTRYTPEDLLAMPDGDRYELVDGNLVERNMGAKAGWVANRCGRYLDVFCDEHRQGWVLNAETGYQCFPGSPFKVRKPDVSFIRFGRLPGEELPDGHILIPPDLAVEVVSPNDLAYEVDEKIQEYLEAKVRLVWEVNPKTRTVWVHRLDGSGSKLRETDELSGENVLPGFRCPLCALFPPPETAPTPAKNA